MKKLLGSTLALALIVPAGANAEVLKNFKMSGSIDVDAVSAGNVTDMKSSTYDHLGTAQTRVMVNNDWDLLDDVHAHVTLRKNNRAWGDNRAGENPESVQTAALTNTFIPQAYVKLDKVFGAVDMTLGRQAFGDHGDISIFFGAKDIYGLPTTGIDAAVFAWQGEKLGVAAGLGKVTGNTIGTVNTNATPAAGDVNFRALIVSAKPTDNVNGSVYLYDAETVNSVSGAGTQNVRSNDELYIAGLKGKATFGGAWIKAQLAQNFGQNVTNAAGGATNVGNYTGSAALVDLGYKADLSNVGALAGWGQFGIGSGGATANRNFKAIAGDYRPGSIYGRFSSDAMTTLSSGAGSLSSNSLGNRVVYGVGVKTTPAALNKLTAGISFWNYRFQSMAGTVATAGANSRNIGSEGDIDLSWAHSENVSLSAGVGSFQPGGFIKSTQAAYNPATLAYADVKVKF